MRVLIACGGTGGHLFPGIAVGEALRARGHEILLLISQKSIDQQALQGREKLPVASLPTVGWPGLRVTRWPVFVRELWAGISAGKKILREFSPSAILGMGGFISAVPIWLGQQQGIPTFLHDSNTVPGKVTRLLARKARRVFLGFGETAAALPGATSVVTGTPVRADLLRHSPSDARTELGLAVDKKTILVMGGSQGARGLNAAVQAALPLLKSKAGEWQFIHLSGERDRAGLVAAYAEAGLAARVEPFSHRMDLAYSAADLVISRSGAGSLTEISHYGLASILIPFPAATDDHQTVNAQVFTKVGAAVLLPETSAQPEKLAEMFSEILENTARQEAMQAGSRQLMIADAAQNVVREVEQCVRN